MYYTFYLPVLFVIGFHCEDVPNISGKERNIGGLVLQPNPDLPKINVDGSTNGIDVKTFEKMSFGTIGASVPMSFTSGRHGRRQIIRPGRYENMERENRRDPCRGRGFCRDPCRERVFCRGRHLGYRHHEKPRRDESSSYERREDKDANEDGSREFDRNPSQDPIQQEQNEVPVPEEYKNKMPDFDEQGGNGEYGNGGQSSNEGVESQNNGKGSNEGGKSQNNGQGDGPNQGQGENSGQDYEPNQGGQSQNNGQSPVPQVEENPEKSKIEDLMPKVIFPEN